MMKSLAYFLSKAMKISRFFFNLPSLVSSMDDHEPYFGQQ